jgi:hypothetical protein
MENYLQLYKIELEKYERMLAQYKYAEDIELPIEKLDHWKNALIEQELYIKDLRKHIEQWNIINFGGKNTKPNKAYSFAISLIYTGMP